MMTAVSEDLGYQEMLAAIGRVALDSGHASIALQQLAETMTGTGLIYVLLRDAPFGRQLQDVHAMVEQATTNEWIRHPPMDAEVRDLILGTLKATRRLVDLRNRVVHDMWAPAPSVDQPSGLRGSRATRWGKETVDSTVGTFHQIASAFFLVACTLGAAERALKDLRKVDQERWHSREGVLSELKRYHRDFIERTNAITTGDLEGWHWVATEIGGRSASEPRRPPSLSERQAELVAGERPSAITQEVWIENLHNAHCPTCDTRLIARAGCFRPVGRDTPTYVQDGRSLTCRAGHALPQERDLKAYNNEHGHMPPPADATVREVEPPR